MIISLIGLMGCGKSSVGRALAKCIACAFVDLDDYIEKVQGRTVKEIFASEGEAAFREMELRALETVVAKYDTNQERVTLVLALGGGTVLNPQCAAIVSERTRSFYLKASVDTIASHLKYTYLKRPLLLGSDGEATEEELKQRIGRLSGERSHIYETVAHHIVDVDNYNINDTVDAILSIR